MGATAARLATVVTEAPPVSSTKAQTRWTGQNPHPALSARPPCPTLLGSTTATLDPSRSLSPTTVRRPRCPGWTSCLPYSMETGFSAPLPPPTTVPALQHLPPSETSARSMGMAPSRVLAHRSKHSTRAHIRFRSVRPTRSFSHPSRTPRGHLLSLPVPATTPGTRTTARIASPGCSIAWTRTILRGTTSPRTSQTHLPLGRRLTTHLSPRMRCGGRLGSQRATS